MHAVRRTLLVTAVATAAAVAVPALAWAQAQQAQPAANPNAGMLRFATSNAAAAAEFTAGNEEFSLQHRVAAFEHLSKAIELDPSFGLARTVRALILGGPTAVAESQKGAADAAATGTSAEALFALAERDIIGGRAPAGRQMLKVVSDLTPNDRMMALVYAANLTDTARINALRAVAAKYPDFAQPRSYLAFYLMPLGFGVDSIQKANGDEAMKHAMDAVRIAPRESMTHAYVAHVLVAQRKFAEAAQHANAAASMMPKDSYAYELLAQMAAFDGNFAALRSALDSASAWTPNIVARATYARSRAMIPLSEGNATQAVTELSALAKQEEDMKALGQASLTHLFAATAAAATRDTAGIEMHLAAARADSAAQGTYNDYALLAYCVAGQGAKGRAGLEGWKTTNGPRATLNAAQNATATANLHRHTACILLNEGKAKEALAEVQQADGNPWVAYVGIETYKAMKNTKAADSVRTALFARKDFSYASSATPVIRYKALKK